MVSEGNHPQMALIQGSEILEFTHIYIYYIYIYTYLMWDKPRKWRQTSLVLIPSVCYLFDVHPWPPSCASTVWARTTTRCDLRRKFDALGGAGPT